MPLRRRRQPTQRRLFQLALLTGLGLVSLERPAAAQMQPMPVRAEEERHPGLWGKSAMGGQLGPWFSSNLTSSSPDLQLTVNSTAFYMEFFYQPRLSSIANLDLSAGAVSRGETRIETSTESSYGTATIYPIGFGLRLAPFAKSLTSPIQPILRFGASLLVGTEQFEAALRYPDGTYYGTSIRSRWAPGFYGAAGFAWVLGEKFALTGCVKYQYARFSKDLFGAKDYSGVQVLFGGMYLYRPTPHRGFNH
ncbi:MAG: hypothetical protein HZB43_09300 [candidate division Zixibacteria bacterium]|nr:hypothetical protein [candidate division Zixibacteria bacterium]